MLCWLAENIVTQFEEIVIHFKYANKRLFSAARQVLKPDRFHFTGKRFELLMFINCNNDSKH